VNHRDFDRLYPKYRPVIQAIARKLVGTDDEMVRDLEQEGAFALFQLDLSRATSNPDAWIRKAIKNRQIDYLRRHKPASIRMESLDARLEQGDQLEELAGGLSLVSHRPPPPKLHDAWEDLEEQSDE
jgi:RNA polymerase sigma factor (sigma-70 family)